jgi:WhiB family redox-sensing transcriptional regulator
VSARPVEADEPAVELLDPLSPTCPEDLPCRTHDADMWFSQIPAQLQSAKRLCLECPARLACLYGAIERREPWGVWGGEIFDQGAIVPFKRGRGRPRKDGRDIAA